MRKIFMTMMAAMLLCVSANAQDTKHEISIAYGGGSTSQILDAWTKVGTSLGSFGTATFDNEKLFGPISAEYFYRINNVIGVGAIGAFMRSNEEARVSGHEYGDKTSTYITVMPAVKFNWLRKHKWGMYSKVGLGYTRAEYKTTGKDSEGTYTKDSSGDNFFNFQASLVGIEAGNRNVRGFAELGFGEQGLIHGGIRFRF